MNNRSLLLVWHLDGSLRRVDRYRLVLLALSTVVCLGAFPQAQAADANAKQMTLAKVSAPKNADRAMKRALRALRNAMQELEMARSHYGGHEANAMELTKHALEEVAKGLAVATQENQDEMERSEEITLATDHHFIRRLLPSSKISYARSSLEPKE